MVNLLADRCLNAAKATGAFTPEELDVLGITTVAGNVPLSLTSRNARVVCELCGRPDVTGRSMMPHSGGATLQVRPSRTTSSVPMVPFPPGLLSMK